MEVTISCPGQIGVLDGDWELLASRGLHHVSLCPYHKHGAWHNLVAQNIGRTDGWMDSRSDERMDGCVHA